MKFLPFALSPSTALRVNGIKTYSCRISVCARRTPQCAAYRDARDTLVNARACLARTAADSIGPGATVGNTARRDRTMPTRRRDANRESRPTATDAVPADR